MKKAIAVTLMLSIAGVALASSVALPWFVDANKTGTKIPATEKATLGVVYLKNTTDSTVTCSIEYFTAAGTGIGPPSPRNTFTIDPKATIAFRPVAYDPSSLTGGQENPASGLLVPDRPPFGNSSDIVSPGNDDKINGSGVISWLGGAGDVQGIYVSTQSALQDDSTALKMVSWAHLLPPGV